MKNLIIEGLSGCGKSTIIKKLVKRFNDNQIGQHIFSEDETFGEFMTELYSDNFPDKYFRLKKVLKEINNYKDKIIILERFHLSYYALSDNWELYSGIDSELHTKNFLIVLLSYNENLIFERALNHFDIKIDNPVEQAVKFFGSEENALKSYKRSQEKRFEVLAKTKMEFINIDTSEKNFEKYADIIFQNLSDNI